MNKVLRACTIIEFLTAFEALKPVTTKDSIVETFSLKNSSLEVCILSSVYTDQHANMVFSSNI